MKYFSNSQTISLDRYILDENIFRVEKEIKFSHPEVSVRIKPGFLTDGASISFGRYLVGCPFEKKYLGPAIVHDALYIAGCDIRWANRIFFDALIDVEFDRWKSEAMYIAVEIGGPFVTYTDNQVEYALEHLEIKEI